MLSRLTQQEVAAAAAFRASVAARDIEEGNEGWVDEFARSSPPKRLDQLSFSTSRYEEEERRLEAEAASKSLIPPITLTPAAKPALARPRADSVDSADFDTLENTERWFRNQNIVQPLETAPVVDRPKPVAKRSRPASKSPVRRQAKRPVVQAEVEHESASAPTASAVVQALPVEPRADVDIVFAMQLKKCVMNDEPWPAGPLTAKHRKILQKLTLLLPQRSPTENTPQLLAGSKWQKGFANVPMRTSCEMCVDARDMPWYNYNQKQKLKDAHFHSPLNDVAKLQANQDKVIKMVTDAGALCSQYKFMPNNRLVVKMSDCTREIIVDHEMAKYIGRHLFTREQQLLPHQASDIVMVQDSGTIKKHLLSLWVLRLSPVYKGKKIEARRIFHLDGDPYNCKLDNLLVMSQDRLDVVSDKCPYGVHSLRTTSRETGDKLTETLILRNTWCLPPDEIIAPRKSISLAACSQIANRKDLFHFCQRYNWTVQHNVEIRFKCKDPLSGKLPCRYYSAILTVAKMLAVSDIILAILGKTPKSLHGANKTKALQCDDACWLG